MEWTRPGLSPLKIFLNGLNKLETIVKDLKCVRDVVLSGHTIPFGIVLVISPVYILHLSTSPRKVVEALVEFYGIELKLGLTQRKNILKYKKTKKTSYILSLFFKGLTSSLSRYSW